MSLENTTDLVLDEAIDFDWAIDDDGDFLTDDFFDSSLKMSVYCERRALPSERPISSQRRGWIGNEFEDFEIGSKIWLYYQSRLDSDVLNDLKTEGINGFDWLVSQEIQYAIDYQVQPRLISDGVGLEVIIERPNSKVEKRFYNLWNNTGKNNGS